MMTEEDENDKSCNGIMTRRFILLAGGGLLFLIIVLTIPLFIMTTSTTKDTTTMVIDNVILEVSSSGSSNGGNSSVNPAESISALMASADKVYLLTEYEVGTTELNRAMVNATTAAAYVLGAKGKIVFPYAVDVEKDGTWVKCIDSTVKELAISECESSSLAGKGGIVLHIALPGRRLNTGGDKNKIVMEGNVVRIETIAERDEPMQTVLVLMKQISRRN